MGRNRKEARHADERRARRKIDQARLRSQVIVAEASAWAAEARAAATETRVGTAEARIDALVASTQEDRALRAEAMEEAARIVSDARVQADYVVAQARVVAEAETTAAQARAELQAERLQASAVAALDQARAEVRAERELAERELARQRDELRDQALLEAARIRDEARTAALAVAAAAESERERVLADAHREAFSIVEQARSDLGTPHELDTSALHVPVPDALWTSAEPDVAVIDAPQPLLAVDGLTSSIPSAFEPAPFAATPLAVDATEPREPALVDLASFWQDEAERSRNEGRRRLRRRSRRS